MSEVVEKPANKYAEELRAELDRMVNAQIDTPEFQLLLTTPLTLQHAQFEALQMMFYVYNRRDCWAFVSARAPFDVKQAIWEHEKDELISDARAGVDHAQLARDEVRMLGLTDSEIAAATPIPPVRACLYAWTYLAQNLPWIGSFTASHFLERRNNSAVVKGGGMSERWRRRLTEQLGIEPKKMTNANVHVEAEEGHTDLIWDCIARHVTDQTSFKAAVDGARESATIDRAFRGSIAMSMRANS